MTKYHDKLMAEINKLWHTWYTLTQIGGKEIEKKSAFDRYQQTLIPAKYELNADTVVNNLLAISNWICYKSADILRIVCSLEF